MPQIIYSGQVNFASLTADDLYVQILQPPGYVSGVPTDVFGCVGTASWGPVNLAVHMGSAQDALLNFGPISAASLTDAHDLATDLALAFGQASSQATLEGWAVRVTDGTDVAASVVLASGVAGVVETATIGGSLSIGDVLNLIFTSSDILGSPITVSYAITATSSFTIAAAQLANGINGNAALTNAGISATASGAVVTVYYSTSIGLVITESVTGTGGHTETITLASGGTSTNGATATAIYTGVLGNQVQLNVVAGTVTGSYSVIVTSPVGLSEIYTNIPGTGFWNTLASYINSGQSGIRGASAIVRISAVNSGAGAPTITLYTLSGGTDGRSAVSAATLLGADSNPGTGLYALRQLSPQVGLVWLVGNTNNSVFPACLAFNLSEGCAFLATLAAGTSTPAALTAVSTNGIHDPSFTYVKDWIYFFDPLNQTTRLVPPTAVIGGLISTLQPQIDPGNKPVYLVLGTERLNQFTGNQPYTVSEIGQLETAGVMLITKPIPGGNVFGIRHGQTTSLSQVTQPFEWWRMTVYLARSFASFMGTFVDQNQSQQPNDPTRNAVVNVLNTFLTGLKSPAVGAGDGLGQIDDFSVVCTFSPTGNAGLGVNTPASIAQHYLFVLVRVRYLSSIRFFILSLVGGTTVVTIGSTPGNQLALTP